jgi:hypothetical protein
MIRLLSVRRCECSSNEYKLDVVLLCNFVLQLEFGEIWFDLCINEFQLALFGVTLR